MLAPKFACPGCGVTVKTASPVATGATIKCPKCGTMFPAGNGSVAPQPKRAAPEPEPAGAEETQEQLASRLARKSKAFRKTKTSGPWGLWLGLAGGGVVLLLIVGLVVGVVLAWPALTAKEDKVTEANFQKLQPGMTLEQVELVLGSARKPSEKDLDAMPLDVSAAGHKFDVRDWFIYKGEQGTIYIGVATSGIALGRVSVVAYDHGGTLTVRGSRQKDVDNPFVRPER